MFKFFANLRKHWSEYRIDTLALIIYNYFIIFLIANKDMEWTFHPFRDDEIADKFGLQLLKPEILPKFGLLFRCLTIICNLFGLLPFVIPKRKYQNYLLPVLIWNAYTITALVENLIQILYTIICLRVPFKVIFSLMVSGGFVTLLYLKLILQVINFYEHLFLID